MFPEIDEGRSLIMHFDRQPFLRFAHFAHRCGGCIIQIIARDKHDIMRDKNLAVFSYGKSDAFAPAHNFTDIRKSDFSKLGYNAVNGNACTFGGFRKDFVNSGCHLLIYAQSVRISVMAGIASTLISVRSRSSFCSFLSKNFLFGIF